MSNGEKPSTFFRALFTLEYWALIVTAWAGYVGSKWWQALPICTAILFIRALPKYLKLWPLAVEAEAQAKWWETVALSVFNSLGASCAAYATGLGTHLLFGSVF